MAFPQLRASITSNFADTDASSQVCTHPTGLTAGDLMLLVVTIKNSGSDRTITTPSGWTLQEYANRSDRYACATYKKVATSGDVSAGSTTVNFSGAINSGVGYAMFAITGAASGSEITISEKDNLGNSTAETVFTATTAITPIVTESLVFCIYAAEDGALAATLTASNYTLTPTTTLTERVDIGYRGGTSTGASLFIATAQYTGTTQITSRSVTVGESITGDVLSTILLVNSPQNATASNALFETKPNTFATLTGSTQEPNSDFQEIEPDFFTQSGVVRNPTVWTNEANESTEWTNETY